MKYKSEKLYKEWTKEKVVTSKRQNKQKGWAPMAHACNPRYSGGRNHEDPSLKSG
jgi:hypothetical protein